MATQWKNPVLVPAYSYFLFIFKDNGFEKEEQVWREEEEIE